MVREFAEQIEIGDTVRVTEVYTDGDIITVPAKTMLCVDVCNSHRVSHYLVQDIAGNVHAAPVGSTTLVDKLGVKVRPPEPEVGTYEYTPPPHQSHPLYNVLMAAIEQATKGKGVRHGGDTTPFLEQPWAHYAKLHGRGFLTGQAAKKLEEAASRLTTPEQAADFEKEVLGAIVYAACAILHTRHTTEQEHKND